MHAPRPRSAGRYTLRSAILSHDNDYGFDPFAPEWPLPRLRVTCVIPYYETGPLARECVARVVRAMREYRTAHADPPETRVVVVDDGSIRQPFPGGGLAEVTVVRHDRNRGRVVARNTGLAAAANSDVTLFVDSDVLVPPDQVIRTCALWGPPGGSPPIVAHLFATDRTALAAFDADAALAAASSAADWRWTCRFAPTWVADPSDWMHVGRRFDLVRDTGFFRRWHGFIGPWMLPNMVLGGCFAVPTAAAAEVGGFDESFAAYGFTETTLIARLVAAGVRVVPQVESAAVHVETNPAHHSQADRDRLLAAAHRKFFTEFLAHAQH